MRKGLFAALLAGTVLAAAAASVLAQGYPNRPIKIIVSFTPGGGNDVYGRTIAQKLWERLGQPVVVENKPGAGGKIRAIGIAEQQRLPQFKDVPTINESLPGYGMNIRFGLPAPAGTPDAIVNKLSDEQRSIVNMPDVRERLASVGFEIRPAPSAEMRRIMATESEKLGKVVKAAGIEPQ